MEAPLRGLVFSPSGFHPLARSFEAWRQTDIIDAGREGCQTRQRR